ncbi:hypothetical protein C8R43DRAFT_1133742 [Mycena crocata]|nr:hypothetical protein C8R43DRAFT_1133742 [Mycena crocata]
MPPSTKKRRRETSPSGDAASGSSASSASSRAARKTVSKAVSFLTPKKSTVPGGFSDSPRHTRAGSLRSVSSDGSAPSLVSVGSDSDGDQSSFHFQDADNSIPVASSGSAHSAADNASDASNSSDPVIEVDKDGLTREQKLLLILDRLNGSRVPVGLPTINGFPHP